MHILIDGRMFANTGVGRCIKSLVKYVEKMDGGHRFTLMVNPETKLNGSMEGIGIINLKRNVPIYSLREQFYLPLMLWREGPNLVHFPNFNIPLIHTSPYVVTINDLIYYLFPDACPSKTGYIYAKYMIKFSARGARKVVTISEYSKLDIERHIGIPMDKVIVVYPGVDTNVFCPISDSRKLESIKEKYKIKDGFIFYVGNQEPRKNLVRLIQAFARLSNRTNFQLVIGGRTDQRRKELLSAVAEFGLKDNVIFTGEVPEEDLPLLYNAAELFAFPSLYEGFGIPPLEAMACGTPVVCSNATSLPEVVGNEALLVNPYDVDELTRAMETVLKDQTLQKRLSAKGLERAKTFTWERFAEGLLKVYEGAVD